MVAALQIGSNPSSDRSLLWGPVAFVGLGLLGFGTYAHFSVVGRTRCDGCQPWHPLFVLAPLVAGALLVAVVGAFVARK